MNTDTAPPPNEALAGPRAIELGEEWETWATCNLHLCTPEDAAKLSADAGLLFGQDRVRQVPDPRRPHVTYIQVNQEKLAFRANYSPEGCQMGVALLRTAEHETHSIRVYRDKELVGTISLRDQWELAQVLSAITDLWRENAKKPNPFAGSIGL